VGHRGHGGDVPPSGLSFSRRFLNPRQDTTRKETDFLRETSDLRGATRDLRGPLLVPRGRRLPFWVGSPALRGGPCALWGGGATLGARPSTSGATRSPREGVDCHLGATRPTLERTLRPSGRLARPGRAPAALSGQSTLVHVELRNTARSPNAQDLRDGRPPPHPARQPDLAGAGPHQRADRAGRRPRRARRGRVSRRLRRLWW
jgi:hypothetical protein